MRISHFQESLNGVSSIRAYSKAQEYIKANEEKVEQNLESYYPSIAVNRWLAVRLEFIGAIIIFSSSLLAAISPLIGQVISSSLAGLSITFALRVTQSLNWCVRQYCEIEANIVSVERIKEV